MFSRHWYRRIDPTGNGCPICWQDIDRLGANPDCEICAAEPPKDKCRYVESQLAFVHVETVRFDNMSSAEHVLDNGHPYRGCEHHCFDCEI